ncbi:MAG: hypothetical protein ACRENY_02110 [Candidatus Dormibacteria bacterium]
MSVISFPVLRAAVDPGDVTVPKEPLPPGEMCEVDYGRPGP